MKIEFETLGNTYFRNETTVSFTFDDESYWFTMIESGETTDSPDVDFEPDEDLPFDLTEEMKDEMYLLAQKNI